MIVYIAGMNADTISKVARVKAIEWFNKTSPFDIGCFAHSVKISNILDPDGIKGIVDPEAYYRAVIDAKQKELIRIAHQTGKMQ